MDQQNRKCVLVLDGELPMGILLNTAAILGITLGKQLPEVVGATAKDKSGSEHPGIITFPVPVLRGTEESIRAIREKLRQPEFQSLTAADFSDTAQICKNYEEFLEKLSHTEERELRYFGIVICGERKHINKLTGNLPLLR